MNNKLKHNSIAELIFVNDLRPADLIIARKMGLGLLDHYVVYLGDDRDTGLHHFAANLGDRVSILTPQNINQLTSKYGPIAIRRFNGSDYERNQALERAIEKFRNSKPYNLLSNNCEHYANYVQTGTEYSQQSTVGYGAMAAGGIGMALLSKNPWLQFFGVAIGIAGTAAAVLEEQKSPDPNQKGLAAARTKLIR